MTIDLHVDTLWTMTKGGYFDIVEGCEPRSIVSKKSLEHGQLDCPVFALYIPHHYEIDATRLLDEQIEFFRRQKMDGYLALEGGGLLKGKITNLEKYAKAGIVYLTLTHNYNNQLGGSATDSNEGLTEFGKLVVWWCEKLGVIVDVSHTSDLTAYDAIVASTKPVIASHSGCRKLLEHPRNITDILIGQIAKTGGLVGIPFVKKFIGTAFAIADHIDHVVQLVGIQHVGIGSDIDGAVLVDGASMERWFEIWANPLIKRGYLLEDVMKVGGGNFAKLLERRFV